MLKITNEIADKIFEINRDKIGYFSAYGAIGCDEHEFSLVYDEDYGVFLAQKSDFEYDGILVRLKKI